VVNGDDSCATPIGGYSAIDLFQLDSKLDDGKPDTGLFRIITGIDGISIVSRRYYGFENTQTPGNDCIITLSGERVYNVINENTGCGALILVNF